MPHLLLIALDTCLAVYLLLSGYWAAHNGDHLRYL